MSVQLIKPQNPEKTCLPGQEKHFFKGYTVTGAHKKNAKSILKNLKPLFQKAFPLKDKNEWTHIHCGNISFFQSLPSDPIYISYDAIFIIFKQCLAVHASHLQEKVYSKKFGPEELFEYAVCLQLTPPPNTGTDPDLAAAIYLNLLLKHNKSVKIHEKILSDLLLKALNDSKQPILADIVNNIQELDATVDQKVETFRLLNNFLSGDCPDLFESSKAALHNLEPATQSWFNLCNTFENSQDQHWNNVIQKYTEIGADPIYLAILEICKNSDMGGHDAVSFFRRIEEVVNNRFGHAQEKLNKHKTFLCDNLDLKYRTQLFLRANQDDPEVMATWALIQFLDITSQKDPQQFCGIEKFTNICRDYFVTAIKKGAQFAELNVANAMMVYGDQNEAIEYLINWAKQFIYTPFPADIIPGQHWVYYEDGKVKTFETQGIFQQPLTVWISLLEEHIFKSQEPDLVEFKLLEWLNKLDNVDYTGVDYYTNRGLALYYRGDLSQAFICLVKAYESGNIALRPEIENIIAQLPHFDYKFDHAGN